MIKHFKKRKELIFSFFPKNSLVLVDKGFFPSTITPLKSFPGSDPLRIIYQIFEVK